MACSLTDSKTQQAFERTETISRYQQRTSPCYQSGSFQARRNVGRPYQANWWARFSHASTFRLYLRKAKGGRRIARLVDSPNLPDGECVYQVTEEGLKD